MCSLIFCKIELFPALLQREKMFCKAARVTLIFTWLYLKQHFGLFLARFCYFHHHLSSFLFYQTTLLTLYITKRMLWFVGNSIKLLWALCHKKNVFTLLCLKYAAYSFIAGKTRFGFFVVQVGCFQCYCHGKRLSASLQRCSLILTLICSKELFCMFLAKVRCFSIMFLRTGFSFFS